MEGYTLNGKTALVTGIEHAIPRATAAVLAEAGADVAVLAGEVGKEKERQAEEAANAVRQYQRRSRAYVIDVTQAALVQAAVDDIIDTWGHLDVLVNGLQAPFAAPFVDTTPVDWERLFSHIVYGTMHCLKAAGRHMIARRHGRMITYVSVLAERGVAHCALYSAAQAALVQLTRSLAVEWGQQGVTLTALGTGWMQDSPLTPDDPQERQRLLRFIPDHRFGQADDLATLTVYLASDLGGNLTGQTMYVEGGVMAHP